MKSTVNWLWNKFSSLPTYLKLPLSLPIIATMMVSSFKIARIDGDALIMFQSYAQSVLNIFDKKKDDTKPDDNKDKHVDKIDSLKILAKNDSINSKDLAIKPKPESLAITFNDKKTKIPKKNPQKPAEIVVEAPKTDNQINFEDEIARINILFSPSLNESSLMPFKSKLLLFCKNKIAVSDPIESRSVEANINIIKLPIDSEARRKLIASQIGKRLNIHFHSVLHNDANSTVLRIGSL
jgi:hypothetical protein